jgi:hypothetical protein
MKKIFSLFAAVLFAGSMMAETVTLTMADFAATSFTDQTSGISVATAKNGGGTEPAYNATGKDLRIYAKGSITISSAQNITGISFTISTQGKKRLAPLTADAGSVTVKGDPDFTAEWTGSAKSVTLTVGDKADYGTDGSSKAGQLDFTAIVVTLEAGDTPQEDTWTVAGSSSVAFGTTWDPTNTANDMVKQNDGTFKWEKENLELADGSVDFKVVKNHSWDEAYPSQDYKLAIDAAGIYTITITFEPENNNNVSATATKTGEAVVVPTVVMHGTFVSSDWADTEAFAKSEDKKSASLKLTLAAGDIEFGMKLDGAWKANGATITRENASTSLASGSGNMHLTADVDGEYTFTYTYETQTLEVTFPKIITVMTCAEAAEAAATAGDEIYKAKGYVTEIAYALSNGSMSFWMADTEDGGRVLEAYKCAVADEADAPKVGDLVIVTGQLTVYQSTKEFKQGCTVEIVERAAEPVNLGDKTIAEFIELKNTKDTCVLTGKVIEIVNDQYGNLTIEDATGSLYVYGVLTPAGESKKFSTLDVAVNDVLTIKATYNEYQGNPQAKNAIFVSREKATPSAIDNATVAGKAQKMIIDGQLFIIRDGVMFNANGAAVK